jgi:hypothetical protein
MNKFINFLVLLFTVAIILGLYACKSVPDNSVQSGTAVTDDRNQLDDVGEDTAEFKVSDEHYKETLEYVNSFINAVNEVIREENFEEWKRFLSKAYIDAYDSPEDLAEYSQKFKKKGYDIRLVNLRDYFDNIVVASRHNLEISHLDFIDESHLKVMTMYGDNIAVMYYMELIDGEWKISLW